MEDINLELLFGLPIEIENVGTIQQPKIRDLIALKQKEKLEIDSLLMPFTLSLDNCNLEELQKIQLKTLDLHFLHEMDKQQNGITEINKIPLFDLLLKSLEFYFQQNVSYNIDYQNIDNNYIIIGENGRIDRHNFDDIEAVMWKLNYQKKPIPEKKQPKLSEETQSILDLIKKGRAKKNEKNATTLFNIVNDVVHGGNSFIPYNEVLNMTYYQLMNTCTFIFGKETYVNNLKIALAGSSENIDLTHWSEKLKQNNI